MTPFRLLPLCLALTAGLTATTTQAQNLVTLYESARAYDAVYQSAKAQVDANLHRAAQAKGGLLPQVALVATATRYQYQVESPAASATSGSFNNQSTTVSATQPLYRPGNLATYQQGQRQMEQAQAQLTLAEQDLIVRVSQAYFDVLAAQDSLTFVQAQKTATGGQLASAKRNFEVGTATITDTREAQARFDLVTAQEIATENDLRIKKLALDQLVGKTDSAPKPLATQVLPELLPADVNEWLTQAQTHNPLLAQSRLALDVAKLETEKAEAGHKPTLDLTAAYNLNSNVDGSTANPSGPSTRSNTSSVGVTFTLPLFAGFATQNRVRETLSLEDKARADLEAAQRNVAQSTRTAFYGVLAGMSQVKALEAAEASSQSALDANKLGYQVGVRINIDVLNAQSQLYQTKRDLAKARYDVLVGKLRLRQASGLLQADDLQPINALLAQ